MKKNWWIVVLALLILLLFVGIFLLFGNPLSLHLAKEGAEDYLQETYPEEKLTIAATGYDFISPRYYARVEGDEQFILYLDNWGHVYFDTRE